MPGRTKEVSEATRRDLLAAAIDLFLEKGVARVTLEQIAKAAGYTRGAIYHHFSNKGEIIEALMRSVELPMEEFLQFEERQDSADPLGALQRRCTKAMGILLSDECRRRIHTILYHRCEFVEELNPVFRRIVERDSDLVAMSEKYFERARDLGQLRPGVSPAAAAFSLYSFATGLHRAMLREPWRDQITLDVTATMDVFFCGFRAR